MEHRRMSGVRVDSIGAARRNNLDRWLVFPGITDLHRAGMRTQQQPALDIKRVVHRSGWMIFWLIKGGKVVPVGFYFRPVRYIEPHRTEYRLNALPCADHGMDAAPVATAARKRHIERLLRQSCFK